MVLYPLCLLYLLYLPYLLYPLPTLPTPTLPTLPAYSTYLLLTTLPTLPTLPTYSTCLPSLLALALALALGLVQVLVLALVPHPELPPELPLELPPSTRSFWETSINSLLSFDLPRNYYIKNATLFEENSILPLPVCLESSGWWFLKVEVSRESLKNLKNREK